MAEGVCVGWKEDRGFGFVRPDEGGADVFVHRRDIRNALWLTHGQRVSFEVVMDDRRGKARADKVRVIDVGRMPGRGFDAIDIDNHFLLND